MTAVRISCRPRGQMVKIDADFFPCLEGDAVEAATDLVLAAAIRAHGCGRRHIFLVSAAGLTGWVDPSREDFTRQLDRYRERADLSCSVFVTLVPKADLDRLRACIQAIASGSMRPAGDYTFDAYAVALGESIKRHIFSA